jgi:hypothetical protein
MNSTDPTLSQVYFPDRQIYDPKHLFEDDGKIAECGLVTHMEKSEYNTYEAFSQNSDPFKTFHYFNKVYVRLYDPSNPSPEGSEIFEFFE